MPATLVPLTNQFSTLQDEEDQVDEPLVDDSVMDEGPKELHSLHWTPGVQLLRRILPLVC